MNSQLFSGKKFYIISSCDKDIKSILIDSGAISQSYLSESISFAISDSYSESEVGEAEDLYKVSVVTSEWVRLCLQWGNCKFMKAFHPSIRNLFTKMVFCLVNINNAEDNEKLKGYIRIYGGSLTSTMNEEVTHMVMGVIEGEIYEKVVSQFSDKLVIVIPDWVVECINSKSIKPVTSFHPNAVFERLKQLQISNENERASQLKRTAVQAPSEIPKKTTAESTMVVNTQQFCLSSLQQAVPISIQDSLLTRQLPTALSRQDPPAYPLCRPTLPVRTSAPVNPTPIPAAVPVQTPLVKSKTSKSTNKHLQEQGLNESEKEAIVQQNLMNILGQSHSRRPPTVTTSSEKSTVSLTNKKPRSPRLKTSPKTPSIPSSSSASSLSIPNATSKPVMSQIIISQQSTLTSTPILQLNPASLPQSQLMSSIISTPIASTPISSDIKLDPLSPKIDTNMMRPLLQQQILNNQNLAMSNAPRVGMVCGLTTSVPQAVSARPQSLNNQEIEKLTYNPGNICTTPSVSTQQLIVQQPSQSLFARQPQRQMPQQQQQQQQHKQLITLGQIQTPGHQIQQHWPNAVHMSPNQHASPAILSPGGLCATVTGPGVQQGGHQMYQLTNQQVLSRGGIINNGNQMMLNTLGNGMPINAPCASMVTNVTGPLHLQTPVGNGNPTTLMLHQQQLHVTGNLPSSAIQSPNNTTGNQNIGMTQGKLLTRNILQHSPQMPAGVRLANPSYNVLQPSNQGITPTNTSSEHGHHPNNGHLARPFPGLLRLPQYVGHEGATTNISRENCLIGCVFYLYGYENISQVKRDNWLSAIRSHGAETVNVCNIQTVTHLIVDCQLEDPDLFKLALRNKTRVVTIYWVNDVIEKGTLEPPFEIIHLPSPFSKNLSFSYIRKQIVSITGFEGEERKKVEYMVIQLGVKYTEYLEGSNTVLICKKPTGKKYEAAQKLGIACVNVRWLQDLYFGDLQTLSCDIDHKYQCFEPSYVSIKLERHTHRVQELMVGWLIPIRLDENSWRRLRVLKEQYETEKNSKKRQAEVNALQSPINSKKLKWELPNLSDEDRKLADVAISKYPNSQIHTQMENRLRKSIKIEDTNENVDEFLQQYENHPPLLVAFTGLIPEQRDKLTDLVISLGGEVTDDMNQFTHLIAKNIVRTPKFYFAILRGCHIVTAKWIQACAYREQFIDEKSWRLEDKEGERQYGFSLQESLMKAKNRQMNHMRPLFDSLEFFLSPRAKHRQVCIDLIRACGGTIREKRPIQKMALMPEPKHLIICHEDDSHLANYLTRTKTGNKAVHHEEFVLSGVMRQELDYDSYQIQYISVMKNAFNNHTTMPNITEHILVAGHHESVPGRESPSRSAMSDSTADTVDTQNSHSESYSLPPTTISQSLEHSQFSVKSEPTVAKYSDSNIFSKIGYPPLNGSASYSLVNHNSVTNSHIDPQEVSHNLDQLIQNSDIKVEDSFFENDNNNHNNNNLINNNEHQFSSMTVAEATTMFCKDQIVTISSPNQETFGIKVDETSTHVNAISSSMIPINVASGSTMPHQSLLESISADQNPVYPSDG